MTVLLTLHSIIEELVLFLNPEPWIRNPELETWNPEPNEGLFDVRDYSFVPGREGGCFSSRM